MTSITKTITAVLLVGLFAISVACEAKTNTKKKYHLVYLVSAEKPEVGAKVFVEPLFLTNGNKIESVYEYCRGKVELSTTEMSSPTANTLGTYCVNKSFNLSPSSLYVLNNLGISINLSTTIFLESKKKLGGDILVMPDAGISNIKKIKNNRIYRNTINSNSPIFFLASHSSDLIGNIVIRSDIRKIDIRRTRKDIIKYAHKILGYVSYVGHRKNYMKARYIRSFDNVRVHSNIQFFGDFDNDRKIDVAVSFFASPETGIDKDVAWIGFGIIYGNNRNELFSQLIHTKSLLLEQEMGRFHGYPLVFFKIKDCRYLLFNRQPGYETISALLTTKPGNSCHDYGFTKIHDPSLYN